MATPLKTAAASTAAAAAARDAPGSATAASTSLAHMVRPFRQGDLQQDLLAQAVYASTI